jgi:hypothetical protein
VSCSVHKNAHEKTITKYILQSMLIKILVVLASTLVSAATASEITFRCRAHGHEITIMGANGCYADIDCDTDEACDDNECMKTPVVTLSEEPPQVTDSVHITEESTSTGTTSATSATSSPSLDSDRNNCGVVGKVCESYESCVLGACDSSTIQYTPDHLADWTKMNERSFSCNRDENPNCSSDHTPDGVGWMDGNYVEWDGVPKSFVEDFSSSKKKFYDWICPTGGVPRGIREAFYMGETPLFADPVNPTKAEVDHWHRRFVSSC